jgi:hypothetical protein
VANQGPSRTSERAPILVVGILTMLLGLGAACSGRSGPAPLPDEAAEGRSPPASPVRPGAALAPRPGADRVRRDAPGSPGPCSAARPSAVVRASSDVDLRDDLRQMATLRLRRRVAPPATNDPYLVSLNPSVYGAAPATPMARLRPGGGLVRPSCRFP